MKPLERHYRTLVGLVYPAVYLDEREEEIIDTLLASAAPERTRPQWGETADLLRSGLAVRSSMFGVADRQGAKVATGMLSAGIVAFMAAMTAAIHLSDFVVPNNVWTDTVSPAFVSWWVAVTLTAAFASFVGQRRARRFAPGIAAVLGLGFLMGPDVVMVPSMTVLGLSWFTLVAWLMPHTQRRWVSTAVFLGGLTTGTMAGLAVVSRAEALMRSPRPHDMFSVATAMPPGQNWSVAITYIAIAAGLVLLSRPRLALTYALLVPPLFICAESLIQSRFLITSGPAAFASGVTVVAITTALIAVSLLLTLRDRMTPAALTQTDQLRISDERL